MKIFFPNGNILIKLGSMQKVVYFQNSNLKRIKSIFIHSYLDSFKKLENNPNLFVRNCIF